MRIVAVITDPRIVSKIVGHLERTGRMDRGPPRHDDTLVDELIREPILEEWPGPDAS